MTDILITPAKLHGRVKVPASKSMCHRAVICAALAKGISTVEQATLSEDIHATIGGMRALGAQIKAESETLYITGSGKVNISQAEIQCGESGSTLRFLIPLALLGDQRVTFTGRGRLVTRPIAEYAAICQEQSLEWSSGDGLPVTLRGQLKPGEFSLGGDTSSQFLTGLLFALPLLEADSLVRLTSKLESKGYVDLTLGAMAEFGVTVDHSNYNEFKIYGRQKYQPRNYKVEGDYSQAAFWLVAGTIGDSVSCHGLAAASLQGDKVIKQLIQHTGGRLVENGDIVTALPASTSAIEIDASDCPDLVPILAVLASLSQGETRIIRAGRLRLKESDRLAAMAKELSRLGADIREAGDSLIIQGKEQLSGGEVDSWNDHRIAMALAIASIRCKQPVLLHGAECVNKSYPDFWRDFISLGGVINERSMGQ